MIEFVGFVAVGKDGVVWGKGGTEGEALSDADYWLNLDAGDDDERTDADEHCDTYRCTQAVLDDSAPYCRIVALDGEDVAVSTAEASGFDSD